MSKIISNFIFPVKKKLAQSGLHRSFSAYHKNDCIYKHNKLIPRTFGAAELPEESSVIAVVYSDPLKRRGGVVEVFVVQEEEHPRSMDSVRKMKSRKEVA
jgi:hypothetical protein